MGQLEFRDIAKPELSEAFKTYDVFWFRLGFRITRELLEIPDRRVRVIVTAVTGLNHIDLDACEEYGVKVLSLRGEYDFLQSVRATAEHTLAITLALLRHIPDAVAHTRSGQWDREPFKGSELYEKTVGIIGYGRLGSITADLFRAFGASVKAYDVKEEKVPHELKTDLDDLFKMSDIVSLHINHHRDNIGFVSREKLALLKEGAVFVNTSRGDLVDEEALCEALKAGKVGGCASDVLLDEYRRERSPLLAMAKEMPARVLMTPHIGGNTLESFDKTEQFMYNKLETYIRNA